MIIELFAFLFGASLLYYFSPRVVRATSALAKALEIDPLVIGLLIVGIGTSLPEISNSIISSVSGHADINAGDSIGSSISQISLVLGIPVLIYGKIKGERQKILFLGGGATLASILGVSMLSKGYLSRVDGILLIISYFIMLYFIRVGVKREYFKVEIKENVYKSRLNEYILETAYSLSGVIIGSLISVYMLIELSKLVGIPEFVLSFLLMSINTSIPEFIICLAAIKEKEYGIAVGDIFGSNIADMSLSLGSGPLIAPNFFSSSEPLLSGLYLIAITGAITLLFARKEQLGRKEALLLILLYVLSIPILLIQ